MRAIIMAGGRGERLKPYTTVIPKPLMPIGDIAILEFVILKLKKAGFDRITITLGYLGNLIEAYVGNGSRFGIPIDFIYEEKPLSTIGPLAFIEDLNETFIVMNGDILTDIDFNKLIGFHRKRRAKATIATNKRFSKIDFGVLSFNRDRLITGFIEKPEYNYDVSMGIYVFEPEVLEYVKKGIPYGLDSLVLDMIQNSDRIYSFEFDGYWLDIGRPDDYEKAIEMFTKIGKDSIQ
ncbi:sugar phosphate nucleotidyltransferase [Clostridium sp. 'White wine YQ']|uniref:sugar phosphate nucleotidyltransferase n=1 Tax=Clostridium sp. 'White wine YQ' TaxID=3027474 RepID=UPI0023661DC7|nr:sugar phosphate nucleotidyltransferase [Clostridium sp. 'White wine YQ']MDD7795330.1 sugar phosphate nucleotidyltransferase [Clostridium sp. 'White wine YQ']